MTNILVDIDALQDTAKVIRRAMREMDDCVRHAYNEVYSIRDNGRGLNDVRQRAEELLHAHRALEEAGARVEQYVSSHADAFANADLELASMIRNQRFAEDSYYAYTLRSTTSANQSLKTWFDTFAINADWLNAQVQRVNIWDLVEQYTWIAELTAQFNTMAVHDWTKQTTYVMDKMGLPAVYASRVQALATMLAQFLPAAESSLAYQLSTVSTTVTKIADIAYVVPHVMDELSVFAHGLVTGDLRPWADLFATHRADEIYTAGGIVFTPLAYVYDTAHKQIIDGSRGLVALGMPGSDIVRNVVEALPSDFAQSTKNSLKWAMTDLYTDINIGIDRVVAVTVVQSQQLYTQALSVS